MPSLNALKAFAVAARLGSFTHAGQVLHVTQGAISRQVKQLEDAMGMPLFARSHQKVELTDAGAALASTLVPLFDQLEAAVSVVMQNARAQQPRQVLRINVPPTFATRWLAPRLSDFRTQFAHIDLSVTTERMQTERQARGMDCLIHFGSDPWPGSRCVPLMRERHIMVSSPLLWRAGQPQPLERSTLLHILDGEDRIPVWESWIAAHGPKALDPQPGLTFSTLDQAINAAVAGAGVVVVDQAMIVRELQSGSLRRHGEAFMDGPHGYFFVLPGLEAPISQTVRDFKHWLLAQLQAA